jgi:hypothetical protein
MPSQAKFYEYFAKDCVRAAKRTDDPKYREQLLKWAREWREAAAREASRRNRSRRKDAPLAKTVGIETGEDRAVGPRLRKNAVR